MILRFATDLTVGFTSNQAERDIRPVKVRRRTSGGTWRALLGLADFAIVQSSLSTAAKWGTDALDALARLFADGPSLRPQPHPHGPRRAAAPTTRTRRQAHPRHVSGQSRRPQSRARLRLNSYFYGGKHTSPVNAASITFAACCLSPRFQRAAPRARVLFPTTSSAALVRASSAVSFSFSLRGRSFSTSCALAPAARQAWVPVPSARPLSRVSRQSEIWPVVTASRRGSRPAHPARPPRSQPGSSPCTPR